MFRMIKNFFYAPTHGTHLVVTTLIGVIKIQLLLVVIVALGRLLYRLVVS